MTVDITVELVAHIINLSLQSNIIPIIWKTVFFLYIKVETFLI